VNVRRNVNVSVACSENVPHASKNADDFVNWIENDVCSRKKPIVLHERENA